MILRSAWALLAAVIALRSAGFAFGILNIDESDFMLLGASAARGELPYRTLVEIKPPLGGLTYAPAALFGGLSILPMRVLGVFWVFATALVLREAARRWTRDEDAGWAAAWLSLLASLCEVPSFGSELMMNLPVAGALWAWAAGRTFAAGALVGIASMYRHQAAIAAVALGLALLVDRRWRDVLFLGAGTLLPWAAAVAIYAALGEARLFLEWAVLRNFAYAGKGAAGGALGRALQSTALCVGAAIVPWALAARSWPRDVVGRAALLLLWLTWVPVALGGRFYEHYYLQFVPPLALLGASKAADLARRWRQLSPRLRAVIVAGCALPLAVNLAFAWGRGIAGRYPGQEPRTAALAAWLRANTAPEERLFVWGHYTPIYTLAQRLPGTRYYNTSVHMGNFDPEHLPHGFDPAAHRSEADVRATVEDLEARGPAIVVDTAPADIHGWARVPLTAFPEIAGYVHAHYRHVASPGGAEVWRRVR